MKVSVFAPTGASFAQNFRYRTGRLPPTIISVRKLDERTFYEVFKNFGIRFFRFFFTIHAFDRRTDGYYAHG